VGPKEAVPPRRIGIPNEFVGIGKSQTNFKRVGHRERFAEGRTRNPWVGKTHELEWSRGGVERGSRVVLL